MTGIIVAKLIVRMNLYEEFDSSFFQCLTDFPQNRVLITYQSVIAACHAYVASGQEGAGQTVT